MVSLGKTKIVRSHLNRSTKSRLEGQVVAVCGEGGTTRGTWKEGVPRGSVGAHYCELPSNNRY